MIKCINSPVLTHKLLLGVSEGTHLVVQRVFILADGFSDNKSVLFTSRLLILIDEYIDRVFNLIPQFVQRYVLDK